jgi:predicted DNA-binding WGR domain protein
LSFSERNQSWKGHKREFQQLQSRATVPGYWAIEVRGPHITTTWGRLGGKLQEVIETMQGVNIGKANEKKPEVYALERAREITRKKAMLEGYREFIKTNTGGAFLDPLIDASIDFDNLPQSLCFYKPDNSMGAGITKKAMQGKVLYGRKRNGLAYILARGTQPPKLYSRRMLRQHDNEVGTRFTWDDRFPDVITMASKVMPENSILLGEMVCDKNGKDIFRQMQSLSKSLTPRALEDAKRDGKASFYIWDIAFWDGEDMVSKAAVKDRYELIHEIDYAKLHGALHPVEFYDSSVFPSPDHALAHAKERGWEGFVVVDPDGVYGDKAYNHRGKPDRPGSFCAKLKPKFEDDFVAIWDPDKGYGERSTKGSRGGGVKSVGLYQYNRNGELVFIANVNSGLTKEMLAELADPSKYPRVWEIEFTGRRYISDGDDTNALDFPTFIRERDDKKPAECVNDLL